MIAPTNNLPAREVKAAFFLVETTSRAGSIKAPRNASEIQQMVEQANKHIFIPQATSRLPCTDQ